MKKMISMIAALAVIFGVFTTCPVRAKTNVSYPYAFEDFEDGTLGKVTGSNAAPVWKKGGAGESAGAAQVTVTAQAGGDLMVPIKGYPQIGSKFRFSAWIKLENTPLSQNVVNFILYGNTTVQKNDPSAEGPGEKVIRGWKQFAAKCDALAVGEWAYVTCEGEWDGSLMCFAGAGYNNCTAAGQVTACSDGIDGLDTFCIRVGNKGGMLDVADSSQTSLIYDVDDLRYEIARENEIYTAETELFTNGDLDSDTYGWQTSGSVRIIQDPADPAPDGSKGFLHVEPAELGTTFWPQLVQKTTVLTNHLYKVSYDVRILSTEMTDNSGNPVTTGGAWMVYQSGKRVPDTNGFNMDYPGYHMENIPIGSWQHVEYYYLHQFKTFGDKENDTLIRVYPTGHQNHASNVTFDIDAISMTDLGLAANADFEIGAKENVCIDLGVSLSTQNVLGWTQNGAVSSVSSDTRPGSTGKQSMEVAVTETGGMVYRGIAPVNGVTYKIGFWAKGKALSAETSFALVFDRTVPESGGDTESYIVPDYQYITGKNEINETKSFGTWKLTNDWQYFECVVSNTFPLKEGLTEPNANTFPRLPFLYLDVDGNAEGTTYLLDDLSIEKNVEKTWPEIANVQLHGDLLPGKNITLSYDYTNETGVQDGHTLARLLATTADGNTASLGCFAADSSFVVPSCAVGKELKLEILPIDRNFVCGVPVTLDVFVTDKEWTTCKLDTASYCATLEASVDETVNVYYAGYEGTKLIKTFLIQKELGAYESAMIQLPAEFSAEDVDSVKVMVFDEQYRPKCTSNTVELPKINRNPFAGDDEINVVFLGGSITYGAGASDRFNTSYASQTSAWLKETYEKDGVTVNCYNEGIGGTPSDFGLLRLNRDVTVHDPDLVFVEFAVNDGGRDTRMYMESIVRSLQAWPTNPYIIFLYTTDETYSTPTMYHEQVAEYYNIPQISLKDALKEHLNGQNAREAGYLTDSVHPSDLGYAVYYNEIVRCLKTNRFFNKPIVHKNKLMESSGSFEIAFHPIADFAVYSDDWTADRLYSKTWLKTTTIGAELNFEFDGTILVFQHGLNAASAMYEVYVDGELAGQGDPYYAGYYSDAESLGFRTFTLPNGHHSVTVKTIKSMNSASEGDQVVLYTAITGRPAS